MLRRPLLGLLLLWMTAPACADSMAPIPFAESFRITGTLRLHPGEGAGVVVLDRNYHEDADVAPESWVEPNLPFAIGFGFDTSNPPHEDPFDEHGNIDGRPERELSLHVDGVEVMNRFCPPALIDEAGVAFEIEMRYVPGGAVLQWTVGGTKVYDDVFVPMATPVAPRLIRGVSGTGTIEDVRLDVGANAPPFPEMPTRVQVFSFQPVNVAQGREPRSIVDFSTVPDEVARVIATVRLTAPPSGMDKWDRRGAIQLLTDDHQRFELLRFVTPFAREVEWRVDVTDFLPLLRGQKTLVGFVDTWRDGFQLCVTLDFFPGTPERKPVAIRNAWQGEPIMGDVASPIENFFDDKTLVMPEGASTAKLRITATGHGQLPNTDNAGEFLPLERVVTVNGRTLTNLLWTDDNYLNPLRPQRGTWKYARAGWGPGRVVEPWVIDLGEDVARSRELSLGYRLAPYVNEARDQGADPPTHWIESQVVYYE